MRIFKESSWAWDFISKRERILNRMTSKGISIESAEQVGTLWTVAHGPDAAVAYLNWRFAALASLHETYGDGSPESPESGIGPKANRQAASGHLGSHS